jgi:hypothetical protein
MPQIRATLALATVALLVGCSSTSGTQHHASSSPAVSQHSSVPSSSAQSSNRVGQSGPCPVTRTWQTAARAGLPSGLGAQNLLGKGPVYPGVYTPQKRWRRQTLVEMEDAPDVPHPTGWLVQKVLWKISRAYRGPVWIRGREIGGLGQMKFSEGADVSGSLHFQARGSWPSESSVPHAGCYAWHIRGRGFHEVLMFRAVCVSGPGYRPCP